MHEAQLPNAGKMFTFLLIYAPCRAVLVAKGSLLHAPWQRGVGDTFIAPTGEYYGLWGPTPTTIKWSPL